MREKSIVVNIAICPPKAVMDHAIMLSKHFGKQSAMFILNKGNHYPHITLYIARFPFRNFGRLLQTLTKIAWHTKPLKMIATKYQQNTNGYVEIEFKKTKHIADLQRGIIRSLNHLRDGLLYDASELRHTPAQKKSYERYGYDHVGREFQPHLSITRFPAALPNFNTNSFSEKSRFSFTATIIYLFLVGENFTSRKILKKFVVR